MANKMRLLMSGIPVGEIYWKIQKHPELWNQYTARTESKDSPHHWLDDIWCRFGRQNDCISQGVGSGDSLGIMPHDSIWYPSADLLDVKGVCYDIMRAVHGDELGGVLITRIPPGKSCLPHTDLGWHARRYSKFALQIASAPGQKFCFDGEEMESKPGDLYAFDNQFLHWVVNPTQYERITMIVCVREGA
jgi:hypothetical protein